ncbi:MAG: hypothetical protein NTV21_06065 [Planctomycetota bacterium]|nr:hypothetical protein [Planctomycetota bacterium]
MKQLLAVLGIAVIAIAVVVFAWRPRQQSWSSAIREDQGSDSPAEVTAEPSERSAIDGTDDAPLTSASARFLVIRSEDGISQQRVIVQAMTPDPQIPIETQRSTESDPGESEAWTAESDTDGRVRIPVVGASNGADQIVVIAKPGFEIQFHSLHQLLSRPQPEISLRSRSLGATVTDSIGQHQPNCLVQVYGVAAVIHDDRILSSRFRLSYQADGDGFVQLPYWADSRLQASGPLGSSAVSLVGTQSHINLALRSCFTVRLTDGRPLENRSVAEYEVHAIVGNGTLLLVSGELVEIAGSTQVEVPYIGSYRYVVTCASADWSAQPSEIVRPRPGSSYEFVLREAGEREWNVRVVEQDERPIPFARVRCEWASPDGSLQWTARMTDPFGRVHFGGIPKGSATFIAEKPGYFQKYRVDVWTEYPTDTPTTLRLDRGGALTGVVARDGLAVRDFTIWYATESWNWASMSFCDVADGRFTIDGIPAGKTEVMASSPFHGQSNIAFTDVSEKESSTVELALSEGKWPSRCQVVDATSLGPLADAEIEVLVLAGGSEVGGVGVPTLTDASGRAEWVGQTRGTGRIRVGRPGYEAVVVSAYVEGDRPTDFGLIRLRKMGSLKLRLVPEGPLRLDWCSAIVRGSRVSPQTLFSVDGVAEFGSVAPGPVSVEILRADRVEEKLTLDLAEGQTVIDVPLVVNKRMAVRILDGLDAIVEGAEFSFRTQDGWARSTFGPSGGANEFLVPVDPAVVEEIEIQSAGIQRVTRRAVTDNERAEGVVVIGSSGDLRFKVITSTGAPIAGAGVLVRRPEGDAGVVPDARTGDDGFAVMSGLGWDLIDVLVFHPQIGVRPSERVDVKELAGRTLELELNPVGRTRVAVRDGEVAIAGVQVRFLDPKYNAGRAMTDEEGVAWSLPLQEGRYRAEVGQSGYWPAAVDFECNKEEVWTTLQVRRTGGLDLEIQSASARDVRSYVLELRSKEFEASVAGWLGAGKVVSPQGGRPDEDGRLEFYGLPNGEYTWTAILDGAGVMAGEIQVGPHATNKKKLMLP